MGNHSHESTPLEVKNLPIEPDAERNPYPRRDKGAGKAAAVERNRRVEVAIRKDYRNQWHEVPVTAISVGTPQLEESAEELRSTTRQNDDEMTAALG